MKKILTMLAVVLLSTPLAARAADGLTVAVVNVQKVFDASTAANDIKSQIKVSSDKYVAAVNSEQEKLRADQKKLSDERAVLSAEAFQEKEREFQERINKTEHELQAKRSKLDAALKKSLNKVEVAINTIVLNLAKENKYDLVLPSSQTLFFGQSLDITDSVLKQLNKTLPKVEVKIEQ